jgi:diacylglycerol kinase family enzyme
VKVCLIHSPGAGPGDATKEQLIGLLAKYGYEASYRTSKEDWKGCFDGGSQMVVVAGGDGTVKRVALELAGRNLPMAVLPTGTANNIAGALGSVGDLEPLVASFASCRRVRVVLGVARGPWGEKHFVEGVGFGLFARTMRDADDASSGDDDRARGRAEKLRKDLEGLLAHARTHPASHAEIWLDGKHVRGEFLLVAVLSIPSVGPRLELAPDKDAADDVFHVALVPAWHREELKCHLEDRKDERQSQLETIVRAARSVKARWFGRDVHIDDDVWPKDRQDLQDIEPPIEVEIEATEHGIIALAPGARRPAFAKDRSP